MAPFRARRALGRIRRVVTSRATDWYDVLGLGLAAAFAIWTLVSFTVRGGNPIPQVLLITAVATAYALGRRHGRTRPIFVAGAILAAIVLSIAVSGPAALAGGPADPPMGYGNANGALYALGVAAAAVLAVCAKSDTVRIPAGVLTVSMFAFAVLTTSVAASVLALGVLLVAAAAHRLGRWFAIAGPLFLMGTIGLTLVVGLGPDLQAVSLVEDALTETRANLWHDALAITADHPPFGAGPGTFAELSPTALSETDLRWAHSAYLQTAAETGIPGSVLLLTVLLWAFGGLVRSHQDERLIVIGIAAAIAFTVQAGIDYLAHFPALVILVALFTGLASSRRGRPSLG